MTEYIKQWLEIIENMRNENTYKLSWGRAILEIISEMNIPKDDVIIHFDQISNKMLKYYWNQTYFFDLKQSSNRKPIIVQETEKCIEYIKVALNSNIPVWYDKAEHHLKSDRKFFDSTITKISTTLACDVCWRFKIVKGENIEIYGLDKEKKEVTFTKDQVIELKEYAIILSQLMNYRWAQLLEKFNYCPNITSKVKGISDAKIRRNSLKKYKDFLLDQMQHEELVDFYSGEKISLDDISIDHVIPWSFMYSDDIWNLVVTSKSNNSKKGNSIPSKETIKKLEERNKTLLNMINKKSKFYPDLQLAVENDYVQRFYMSCKL